MPVSGKTLLKYTVDEISFSEVDGNITASFLRTGL